MSCDCKPGLEHLTTLAAAYLRLRLAAGRLRNIDPVLCENGRSVMIYAQDQNGADLHASFELPSAITEEQFDREYWASVFDPTARPGRRALVQCHLDPRRGLMND